MQSRKGSLIESVLSTAVGFCVTMLANLIIFPAYGIKITMAQNIQIVMIMTVISILRQYFMRRIFNNITLKRIMKNDK